jgi:hypothetical protein
VWGIIPGGPVALWDAGKYNRGFVGDEDKATSSARGGWRRRAIVAALLFCALLVVFHRPVLLTIGRFVVRHYAAGQNLRANFRLEGNVFTYLIIRNLHVVSTGPSEVESIDADLVRVDYNLWDLVRRRMPDFLQDVQVCSARIVLNPAKAPPKPRRKKASEKSTGLPGIFPKKLQLSDATVVVRDSPRDFVVEHLNLDLNPRTPGELKIERLQFPTGQTWSRISAQTSYENRNLILRDLAITDSDRIRLLDVDASRIDDNQLSIKLDAAVGGGTVTGSVGLGRVGSSLSANVHLVARQVTLADLNKYAALPNDYLDGGMEELIVDGAGVLDAPRTWKGTVTARINDFRGGDLAFDRCVLEASVHDGAAVLRSANVLQGDNQVHLQGSGQLPEKLRELPRSHMALALTAKVPDLSRVAVVSGEKIAGSAQANGKLEMANGELTADLDITAGPLQSANGSVEKLAVSLKAAKTISGNAGASRKGSQTKAAKQPWFSHLQTTVGLNMASLRFRDYAIDSVNGSLASSNDSLKIEKLDVRRKENELTLRGRFRLPENAGKLTAPTGEIEFTLNAPAVGDLWVSDSPDKWTGPLQGNGQIYCKDGIANGAWSISASNLQTRNLVLQQVSSQCAIASNVVYLNDFSARLTSQDFISANGTLDLHAPYRYSGKFSTNLSDLSKLQPLLRELGDQNELAGSLMVNWEGIGVAAKFRNTGKLKLVLENGRYGNLRSLRANVDATYSPEQLDIPTVFVSGNGMDFQAIVQAKGEKLEITKMQLDQGQARYASGYISIPFVWKNLGTSEPLFPANGRVLANFQSEQLDMKKLFQDLGTKSNVAGTLNVKLDARGTFADLDARLGVEMRDLRSEKLPKLEPASITLSAEVQHNQLAILGKLQQSRIQPVELKANLPFDLATVARERKLPDNTPVTAQLQLPRSSVNFIRQFIPAVRQVDGDVAVNTSVSGTIGQPVFAGTADMTINYARASDPTLPGVQNFKARLRFDHNALTLEQFGGELSGGHFTVAGRIVFPKLTSANLDLRVKADSALIARNDTLTVRTDADLKIEGPINRGSITGTVALTNSRFLKNIDLIPIGLPGRPAPQPPASRPELSFPASLRGWKFDIALKTKDPVLIRGNLATGKAVCDLHLTGTGARPLLDGVVRLENAEATLPFSRLEVSSGFLYFDPNDPLNPKIDLHGTSLIQNYTVRVYVYGTMLSPEAVFSSEPPLPQEDIISLLATGTTRQELAGNNSALAGRAAMLLVQQLYHKIFKTGQQPTQSSSVFDRLSVDFGAVDPRTGQQQATARFKINNQFVLIGDVGVGGDYRGMVKYLIRFH